MLKHRNRALRNLPAVYFYLPAPQRGMGHHEGLAVTEDICAVLYLTELASEPGSGALQGSVRKAAALTPSRMSTVLTKLVPRFLTCANAPGSRRANRLTLTAAGKRLLATIKEERAAFLDDLFEALTTEEQGACAAALTTLEATLWRKVPK